jgi:cysteate synthase
MSGKSGGIMTHSYMLQCALCDTEMEDDGFLLKCPVHQESTLLTSHYFNTYFDPDTHASDITRYRRWLPWRRKIYSASRTVTYQDTHLNRKIELPNLWIAFNGYWPEKGATLETATFKELEAYTVLARLPEQSDYVLVLASAGNTAAAFAHLCSQNKIRCLIVIPEQGSQRMIFSHPLDSCVKIVTVSGFSDYYDAITLAERVSQRAGFFYEGGVRNVGRRDGIGTTLLNAVETIGQLPDYYFQAIGSGTGGIAVHEAAKRLIVDGNFGKSFPRLMLSQNTPFSPMYHSWKAGQRALIAAERDEVKRQIQQIAASVLSNQAPPYAVRGGVFDVLQESRGDMFIADNRETYQAMQLFQESQDIDIDPAAGVAFATLLTAATSGQIERDATILLHITGGGRHRHQLEKKSQLARPDLEVDVLTAHTEETIDNVVRLFE